MSLGKDPPGIISYLETMLPLVRTLSDQEVGAFYRAMLEYGDNRSQPEFTDKTLRSLWIVIRPQIDRDIYRYHLRSLKGKWGVYKRECRKQGLEPLSFEDWYVLTPSAKDAMVDDYIRGQRPELPITDPARYTDPLYSRDSSGADSDSEWGPERTIKLKDP